MTFSEYAVGTSISTQYGALGVLVGGSSPFITTDGSNPTSPVLSGSPRFNGDITIYFVAPGNTNQRVTATEVSFDLGYFDEIGSTLITWFDANNVVLGSRTNRSLGIERVALPGTVGGFTTRIIGSEPAGYAMDNLTFRIGDDLKVTDKNSNVTITEGGLAHITSDDPPKMPDLEASFTSGGGANNKWKFLNDWTRSGYYYASSSDPKHRFSEQYLYSFPAKNANPIILPVAQKWDLGILFRGNTEGFFGGGKATITVTPDKGKAINRTFRIFGDNPTDQRVIDVINRKKGSYWFLQAIAYHESDHKYDQFKTDGTPLYGPGDGWGIFQIEGLNPRPATPPKHSLESKILWNYQNNIDAAIATLGSKQISTNNYFEAVKRQYPNQWIDPPDDITANGVHLTAYEATTIMHYNGSSTANNVTVGRRTYRAYYIFHPNETPANRWELKDNQNSYVSRIKAAIDFTGVHR